MVPRTCYAGSGGVQACAGGHVKAGVGGEDPPAEKVKNDGSGAGNVEVKGRGQRGPGTYGAQSCGGRWKSCEGRWRCCEGRLGCAAREMCASG